MPSRNHSRIRRMNPDSLSPTQDYSHVVIVPCARTLYIAGQVPLDKNGELVGPGDFEAQVRQTFLLFSCRRCFLPFVFLVQIVRCGLNRLPVNQRSLSVMLAFEDAHFAQAWTFLYLQQTHLVPRFEQ